MDAVPSPIQIIRLRRLIIKACEAWGEPSFFFEPYINDILARVGNIEDAIACFEGLIKDAPKNKDDDKTWKDWKWSPGKLHLPVKGHEDCCNVSYGSGRTNASQED